MRTRMYMVIAYCLVSCMPRRYKEDPELSEWVIAQRNLETEKLFVDQTAKLDSIGFL